jgi:hypothetical protein
MNWNKWRALCAEEELTFEQTRESWSNYKEMVCEAEIAALRGDTLLGFVSPDSGIEFTDYLKQMDALSKDIEQSVSDALEDDESNEEVDVTLFENAEKSHAALVEDIAAIGERSAYYRERAQILDNEAEDATDSMIRQIRRAIDD